MASPASEFVLSLGKSGYKAAVVPVSRACDLRSALERLRENGDIDPDFYPHITRYLNFDYASVLPAAQSIIVIASPQPPTRVLFGGQPVIIPPTYIYRGIWQGQLRLVSDWMQSRGYAAARARLPLKTLAVRSGLGKYGRNNICYVPGMGSFHRLGAFYSDMPCEEDAWREPEQMKKCLTCAACLENCPTGCISGERFLIHAERCLTHFNESEEPMPRWINPAWHNALLGCMRCQDVCPVDRPFMGRTRQAEESFTAEETEQILSGKPISGLGKDTAAKLESLCLADEDVYPLLKRNLSLLLRQ